MFCARLLFTRCFLPLGAPAKLNAFSHPSERVSTDHPVVYFSIDFSTVGAPLSALGGRLRSGFPSPQVSLPFWLPQTFFVYDPLLSFPPLERSDSRKIVCLGLRILFSQDCVSLFSLAISVSSLYDINQMFYPVFYFKLLLIFTTLPSDSEIQFICLSPSFPPHHFHRRVGFRKMATLLVEPLLSPPGQPISINSSDPSRCTSWNWTRSFRWDEVFWFERHKFLQRPPFRASFRMPFLSPLSR